MGEQVDDEVDVTGGAALDPRPALARDPDPGALDDPGGDAPLDRALTEGEQARAAGHRLLEGDVDALLEVGAATGAALEAERPATGGAAEEVVDVEAAVAEEGLEEVALRTGTAAPAAAAAASPPGDLRLLLEPRHSLSLDHRVPRGLVERVLQRAAQKDAAVADAHQHARAP